jgi:membrane fusion protein, multidrug efflux system
VKNSALPHPARGDTKDRVMDVEIDAPASSAAATVARVSAFPARAAEAEIDETSADRTEDEPMKVRPLNGWILALLAAVVIAVVAWSMTRDPAASMPMVQSAPGPLELSTVDVASVQARVLSRSLPLSGSISPFIQATVKSKVSGEVEQVTVREGQDVRQGDVIARVDTRNLRAQYDREMAAVEKARADLNLAELNRDKNRAMLQQRYISQNTYESTESAYASAVASLKLAEAQGRLAKLDLDDAVIRAPFDGTVARRLVQPGEKVSADSSIVTLVDLRQMLLEAALPTAEIPLVKEGQKVRFRVGGFGAREFRGEVQRINPMAADGSRAIMIYVAVANADRALKGGMFATGELTLQATDPVLAVPQPAVHEQAGETFVYALADGKIARKPVKLAPTLKGDPYAEVREGLAPGDQVIVADIGEGKEGRKAFVGGADAVAHE